MSYFDRFIRRFLARSIIDRLVRHGFVPVKGILRDVFGYVLKSRILKVPRNHALYAFFQERDPNSCVLSNTTLVWLWAYLCKTEPECIVEMGSGRSTVIFSLYAQQQERNGKLKPTVISIESEKTWLVDVRAKLEKYELTDFVSFMHCKLINNSSTDKFTHGYVINYEKLNKLLDNKTIDLLLIDGPSGGQGRGATLPCLAEKLKDSADVFLDDASRKTEQESIRYWLNLFSDSMTLKGDLPLGSGLAWMKIVKKII